MKFYVFFHHLLKKMWDQKWQEAGDRLLKLKHWDEGLFMLPKIARSYGPLSHMGYYISGWPKHEI